MDPAKRRCLEGKPRAQIDVSNDGAVRPVVDAGFGAMGRVDVVVSNAGYGLFGAAEEVSDEQIRHQIDTNLIGSIQVIRAALPHMRARRGGRILQVSSEGGLIAYPNFSLYHATKWGIEGFIEAVSQEVASPEGGTGLLADRPPMTRRSGDQEIRRRAATPARFGPARRRASWHA
ncbi:hypothetical protein RLEG3_04345 (plasmid) [Rhizobium leguminosarum bv. trifolii WSM1689]|nr:hypothetical protein RLEG3_04345 [Rhizobium leguminosarum bv. trifolii WSM1689]